MKSLTEHLGEVASLFHSEKPSAPSLVNMFGTDGIIKNIFVSGDYAFVTEGTSGMEIFDVFAPSSSPVVGSYSDSDSFVDVYVWRLCLCFHIFYRPNFKDFQHFDSFFSQFTGYFGLHGAGNSVYYASSPNILFT